MIGLHGLEVSGVVEHKLARGNNGGGVDGVEDVDQACTLLGQSLQRITISLAGRDRFGRCLEKCPNAVGNSLRFSFDRQQKCRAAGNERRGH